MTGLEKIVAQIKLDADNTAESIKAKSNAQCEKLLAEAQAEADTVIKNGEIKAQQKYDDIIARANSAAELEERKIMLFARQGVISDMVSKAMDGILNLPQDKYFELIYKMISRYSENADGIICLGENDLNRIPADFESKANSAAKGSLKLSQTPATIDGGFILTYGSVDVNCSFSALFSDNSEKISDAVAKLLFA